MQKSHTLGILSAAAVSAIAGVVGAQTTQPVVINDVLYGLSRASAPQTTYHIRGSSVDGTGSTKLGSTWSAPFIQGIQFDNTDGFRHAADGNLLGMNFGALGTGTLLGTSTASIHNMETRRVPASTTPGLAPAIFDFTTYNALPDPDLTISRLSGLSVSPKNNRIAFTGNDSGRLYVLDYNSGATPGTGVGASVSNGREANILVAGGSNSHGTAWLDNNTVIALDNNGVLHSVNATTMADSTATTLAFDVPGVSAFSSILYEPTVSPLMYVGVSQFSGVSFSRIFVLDPANSFASVGSFNYSTSSNTMREMAFDSKGNLIWSEFGNTTSVPIGGAIEQRPGGNILANLADNNSSKYFIQNQSGGSLTALSAQFSGVDVAASALDFKNADVTVDTRNKQVTVPFFPGTVADPTTEIRTRLLAGYNGGDWNGTGAAIISSNAAADALGITGIGYAYADEVGQVGNVWGGVTVDNANNVLLKYTWNGDTDLNGVVDFDDYVRTDGGFNGGLTGWTNGDFDYNNTIDFDDYVLIDGAFNGQNGTLADALNWLEGEDRSLANASLPGVEMVIEHYNQFGMDYVSSFYSSIPEPTAIALLGIAGAGLIRRRRSR